MTTIIVLLILAGISIAMISNSNLLDKTKIAKEKYENKSDEEQQILSDYTNAIDNYEVIGNRSNVTSHVRFSNPIYKIAYDSGSNVLGAATRKISSFLNNQVKSSNFDNYFEYDTKSQNLICKKEGYYILNLNARCYKNGGDGQIISHIVINNVETSDVDSWTSGSDPDVQVKNPMTVYLFSKDTINFSFYNSTSIKYTNLNFEIFPN